MPTKRVKDPLNEGFNKMFKNLLNEDMKRDDIDADADDKKELAKKNFMKKKDDADSDRDYKLKKKGLKESTDHAALELAEKDYAFNPLTGDILLHKDVEYSPEVGEIIELKFLDDNDDKWYTYKVTEAQKDSKYPYICEYISEKKEFVESKKSLKEHYSPKTIYNYLQRHRRDNGKLSKEDLLRMAEEIAKIIKDEENLAGERYTSLADVDIDDLLETPDIDDWLYRLANIYWGFGDEEEGEREDNEDDEDFNESLKRKSLKESDKPAATSIKDAQKWVDYDMKKYGKISQRTNDLVKKAGFQIIKDDHGDYEVTAGKFESYKKILGAKGEKKNLKS